MSSMKSASKCTMRASCICNGRCGVEAAAAVEVSNAKDSKRHALRRSELCFRRKKRSWREQNHQQLLHVSEASNLRAEEEQRGTDL